MKKLRELDTLSVPVSVHSCSLRLEACQEPLIVRATSRHRRSLPALFGPGRYMPTSFRLVRPRTTPYYWWNGMKRDVAEFVARCQVCQKVKAEHQQPGGLLQPLEIPEWKWDHISMDFVVGLPKSRQSYDVIWVIVDRLTKSAHFLPVRMNYNFDKLATLYMDNIVRLHGVPVSILSDRDPRFVSRFWKSFQDAMGTKVTLSTAYHPQTDGQTEKTIQTLEDMLRACVLEFSGHWSTHLPLIEFAYNNSYHNSIGMAPYEALYGRKCRSPLYWDEVGEKTILGPVLVQITVDKVAIIRERLKAAQDRQKSWVNLKRRPVEFNVGEKAYVKVVNETKDVHPVVEMSTRSKLSYLTWNKFAKNHIASSDYEGIVTVWDVATRQSVIEYEEHEKRAWSVDFSRNEPSMLVFGSDDCKVKVWCTNQEASVLNIDMKANICCVKYSPESSKFVVVRAFRGDANEKNFVGLTGNNEFLACGSETNEFFFFHKAIFRPSTWHRFGSHDLDDNDEDAGCYFICAVCWKSESPTMLAASSKGTIRFWSLLLELYR